MRVYHRVKGGVARFGRSVRATIRDFKLFYGLSRDRGWGRADALGIALVGVGSKPIVLR